MANVQRERRRFKQLESKIRTLQKERHQMTKSPFCNKAGTSILAPSKTVANSAMSLLQ
ncbi:hypothetical protein OK016_14120 [Vibrio chagasii]|nr:hypothetical protein [Vibrio chagasii]